MISILVADDLSMRTYNAEDAQELFQCINASRLHLRPFLSWIDATTRPEHSLQFIQHSLMQQTNQQGLALGIFLQHRLIGTIGMHAWDHELAKAQIGYWMAQEYEGQGLMTRCANRFIDFLFQRLQLNKVEIHYLQRNTRSHALAERLGAKVEGIIRQSHKVNGMLEDLVVTGILRSEWTFHT